MRLLIVGAGDLLKRLLKALGELAASNSVAGWLVDIDKTRLKNVSLPPGIFLDGALPGDVALRTDISSCNLDVAHIATPPRSHVQWISRLAGYVTLVLCEKPLCVLDQIPEAKRLLAWLRAQGQEGRVLVVDHYLLREVVRYALYVIREKGWRVRRIEFTSAEQQLLWRGDCFRDGYVLEHLCHALSIAWHCRADLVKSVAEDTVRFATRWRYVMEASAAQADPPPNTAREIDPRDDPHPVSDSGGRFEVSLKTVDGDELRLRARAAKGCPRDEKLVEVVLEDDRKVVIDLSSHQATFPGNAPPAYDASTDPPPYRILYQQAIHKSVAAGVLPFGQALAAVEIIARINSYAGNPQEYTIPATLDDCPWPPGWDWQTT